MTTEFTVRYSEPLVRAAVWQFWRRVLGWRYLLALAALVAIVAYRVSRGDRSWYVGVFGTIAGLGAILAVVSYVAQRRRAMGAYRRLDGGAATVGLSERALHLSSAIGSTELSWDLVREVWRYPAFWLLVFSKNAFATLPLEGVPDTALELIRERVSHAGGRVA